MICDSGKYHNRWHFNAVTYLNAFGNHSKYISGMGTVCCYHTSDRNANQHTRSSKCFPFIAVSTCLSFAKFFQAMAFLKLYQKNLVTVNTVIAHILVSCVVIGSVQLIGIKIIFLQKSEVLSLPISPGILLYQPSCLGENRSRLNGHKCV